MGQEFRVPYDLSAAHPLVQPIAREKALKEDVDEIYPFGMAESTR
jgi:hypothetical protein